MGQRSSQDDLQEVDMSRVGCCRRRLLRCFKNRDVGHEGSRSILFHSCDRMNLNSTASRSGIFHSCSDVSAFVQGLAGHENSLLEDARGSRMMMMSAVESLKQELAADPENMSLKLACAEAVVSVMRIAGNGNALTCHFKEGRRGTFKPEIRTLDTSGNRVMWAELAPTAQRLLSDVERILGQDAFTKQGPMYSLAVEALMYATSAQGVVAAILSGHAVSFLSSVAKLEKMHPELDGHLYCIYKGAYYLSAPWPVYDAKKAHSYFERSVGRFPSSRRNQYFAAVGRFALEDYSGAREAMERCLQAPSPSATELDIRDFLEVEATRTIEMLIGRGY